MEEPSKKKKLESVFHSFFTPRLPLCIQIQYVFRPPPSHHRPASIAIAPNLYRHRASRGQAIATITTAAPNGVSGTGFLIHRNLLLTTHANLPSVVAADTSEIRLHNVVPATLAPKR
ncbi:hypothetical protein Fmac_018059 [Flemingia macrophylla]|uniref:Uncharacterized protein n=1 Tax=Flemingia macrophylla TaxID=520843 RepID=A0ABD1M3Y2_9FABA